MSTLTVSPNPMTTTISPISTFKQDIEFSSRKLRSLNALTTFVFPELTEFMVNDRQGPTAGSNLLSYFSSLPKLQKLSIQGQIISGFPSMFGNNLPSLKILNCGITSAPSFGDLIPSLVQLDLSGNQLEYFPMNVVYPNLESLNLKMPNQQTNINVIFSTALYPKLKLLYLIPKAQTKITASLPTLKELIISQGIGIELDLTGSTSLQILEISSTTLYKVDPIDLSSFSSLVTIDLSENLINEVIPEGYFVSTFNAQKNQLNGVVPESLCQATQIDLANNQLTDVPDCFKYAFISNPSFDLIPESGDYVSIKGKSLGWGIDLTSGLTLVTPNTEFKYKIPPKSEGITSTSLRFGPSLVLSISWNYRARSVVSSASFIQMPGKIFLSLQGTFTDQINSLKVGSETYTPYNITANEIQFYLPPNFQEGNLRLDLNTDIGVISYQTRFVRKFPIVTSYDTIPRNGGIAKVYGSFFTLDYYFVYQATFRSQNIFIQGVDVNFIILNFPSLEPGFGLLELNISNYIYSTKLYIEPENIDTCKEDCAPNGVCSKSQCVCNEGWSGPTCKTQITKDVEQETLFIADVKQPNGTYSYQDIQYGFSIEGVEEIDSNKKVITYKQVDTWSFTESTVGDITIMEYKRYYDGGMYIGCKMEFSNKSRSYTFAGIENHLEPNSIKMTVNITGWNFVSSLNTLRVVMRSQLHKSSDKCSSEESKIQVGNRVDSNLQYFTLTKNGVTFYGRFLDKALSNGKVIYSVTEILETSNNDNVKIGINLPNCFECILDPDYSLLVQVSDRKTNCDERAKWVLPVAIVVPIVGASAIVVAAVVLKKKFYFSRSGKSFTVIRRGKSSNSISMRKT
eukprot:gene10788-13209_t